MQRPRPPVAMIGPSNTRNAADRPRHRGGASRPVMPCTRMQAVHSWSHNDHIYVWPSNRFGPSHRHSAPHVSNWPLLLDFVKTTAVTPLAKFGVIEPKLRKRRAKFHRETARNMKLYSWPMAQAFMGSGSQTPPILRPIAQSRCYYSRLSTELTSRLARPFAWNVRFNSSGS